VALMMGTVEQVAARRQLGNEIRQLRKAAKLTGQQLAQAVGWHQSKVSRIEAGRNLVRVEDVEALLRALPATTAQVREVLDLAAVNVGEPGSWRNSSRSGLTRRQRDFIALEASAVSIQHYQPVLLPGYMQSEAYARRVAQMAGARDLDRAVDQRLARRATLTDRNLPRYAVVLLETVLRWRPVPPAAMADQLDLVVRLASRQNVELRIVSLDAEQAVFVQHPFMLFEFVDSRPEEGLVETTTQDLRLRDVNAIGQLRHFFNRLSSGALTPTASLALVRKVADSYRDMG
jgi:transcriptional regulator with XRE-family HTH domain